MSGINAPHGDFFADKTAISFPVIFPQQQGQASLTVQKIMKITVLRGYTSPPPVAAPVSLWLGHTLKAFPLRGRWRRSRRMRWKRLSPVPTGAFLLSSYFSSRHDGAFVCKKRPCRINSTRSLLYLLRFITCLL